MMSRTVIRFTPNGSLLADENQLANFRMSCVIARTVFDAKSCPARNSAKRAPSPAPTGTVPKTLSPEFFTLYLHKLDTNLTPITPNWADKGNYRPRLSPES